jgi:hypothetical protein
MLLLKLSISCFQDKVVAIREEAVRVLQWLQDETNPNCNVTRSRSNFYYINMTYRKLLAIHIKCLLKLLHT